MKFPVARQAAKESQDDNHVTGVIVTDQNAQLAQKIGASVAGQDDTTALVSLDFTDPQVAPGSYSIALISYGVSTNALTFTVADTAPTIESIEQLSPLYAGGQDTIVISGTNFGVACAAGSPCPGAGIQVCTSGTSPCTSSDVTPSNISWSDTQITAQLNAGLSASGFYDVVVTSAGATGNGFLSGAGGGTGVSSNPGKISATQPSNLVLSVRSNGNLLSAGNCANIDTTPQMPQISAQVRDGSGNTVSGTVTWQIFISFPFKSRTPIPGGGGFWGTPVQQYSTLDTGDPQQLSADQTWNATFNAIRGGAAELRWTYNGIAQPIFRFRICGQNPDFSLLDSALGVTSPAGYQYWFLRNIAIHETNESQFCQQTRSQAVYCASQTHWGYPVFGIPAGYGTTRLDPVDTRDQLWDWRANATGGVARLDAGGGYTFWRSQVQQWQAFNRIQSAAGFPVIPEPPDDQETTSCTFTISLDVNGNTTPNTGRPNTYWFGDAIAMKGFAGGVKYISWNSSGAPNQWSPPRKVTQIPVGNGIVQQHNFVYEFCTCTNATTPPSSNRRHQTP